MSALTRSEADSILREAEVVPCVEGSFQEMKELLNACLEAGIPAVVDTDPSKPPAPTGPRALLAVRTEDLEKVRALMQDRWRALVEGLGVEFKPPAAPSGEDTGEGDLPCPACGTAAPLVNGACSDCGLQLE
jgi:hypothetical protein